MVQNKKHWLNLFSLSFSILFFSLFIPFLPQKDLVGKWAMGSIYVIKTRLYWIHSINSTDNLLYWTGILKISLCLTLFKSSLGKIMYFQWHRAATGGKAVKFWSLARLWEIENGSNTGGTPVKCPPLWCLCLPKIYHGGPVTN